MRNRIFLGLALWLLFGCGKIDETGFTYEVIENSAIYAINHINYAEGIGYIACGGSRYDFGFWMQSADGKNWFLDSITNKALYKTDFIHPDFGFVVGFDGRIHRTQDGAQSWSLYQYGNYHPFNDITVINDSVIFLVGGRSYENGYIAYTTTGGNRWEGDLFEESLKAIHFINRDIGFAAGYGVLYMTLNGGENWEKTAVQGDFFIELFFVDDQTGFLLGYQGKILRTENGGLNWQTVHKGNRPFITRMNPEAMHFYDAQHGMVVGRNGLLLYTNDSGSNWKKAKGLPDVDFKSVFMQSPTTALVGGKHGKMLSVTKAGL